jgi:hypothetical protein
MLYGFWHADQKRINLLKECAHRWAVISRQLNLEAPSTEPIVADVEVLESITGSRGKTSRKAGGTAIVHDFYALLSTWTSQDAAAHK